jgi:uncharacterized membrane protein
MSRAALKKIPLRPRFFPGWTSQAHRIVFGLFLVQCLIIGVGISFGFPATEGARWPDGLLVVLAAATTVCSLMRQLPAQNVMLAGGIVCAIAAAAHTLGVLSGIPFGPIVYTERIKQVLFPPLPWAIPVLWFVVLLNARGVSRLILRPWRRSRNYGFWLMGVTVLLVVLFDFGLEPFATQVKRFWIWDRTNTIWYWHTTPWANFLGWTVTALLMLAFATPSLINKKPVKHPPQFHPLAVWLALNIIILAGAIKKGLWPAFAITAAGSIAIAVLALRGGRTGRELSG